MNFRNRNLLDNMLLVSLYLMVIGVYFKFNYDIVTAYMDGCIKLFWTICILIVFNGVFALFLINEYCIKIEKEMKSELEKYEKKK